MILKFYIFICFISINAVSFSQNPSTHYTHIACSPDTIKGGTPQQIKIYVIADSVSMEKNTNLKIFFPKEFSQFAFENNPPPFPFFPSLQHGYCVARGSRPSLRATIISLHPTRDE